MNRAKAVDAQSDMPEMQEKTAKNTNETHVADHIAPVERINIIIERSKKEKCVEKQIQQWIRVSSELDGSFDARDRERVDTGS